jgi:gluconokinase
VGTGAVQPGVAGLSIGTSGAIRMVVPEPRTDPDGRLFCYALTDDAWVVGGAVSNGGVAARWAGGVFGPARDGDTSDAELMALAASVPPGSDGLVALPYLLAERAPLWDPSLTGAFLGMRHSHTRGHFVRAVIEGVASQLAVITDGLERLHPVHSVRATGGVFRSPVWRDVVAGALARPLTVTGGAEGSALGAAALGLLALGRNPGLDSAVAALSVGAAGVDEPAVVSTDTEVYARLRASVPFLVDALGAVADLYRPSTPPAAWRAPQTASAPAG